MSSSAIARLRWSEIDTVSGWQSALLPVPAFPLQPEQAVAFQQFFGALPDVLREAYGLHHEVLLQAWKVGPETGAPVLRAHRSAWRTQLGLGVWPDRPPSGWTEEEMVDAAAAVYRGDEPQMPSHPLLRLRCLNDEAIAAARALRRFGVLVETFSERDPACMDTLCRDALLPRIQASRFQHEDFYRPLLDRARCKALPQEDLTAVLGGAAVYVRDSAEDKGMLIVSRLPLLPLFEAVSLKLRGNTPAGA